MSTTARANAANAASTGQDNGAASGTTAPVAKAEPEVKKKEEKESSGTKGRLVYDDLELSPVSSQIHL